MAGAKADRRKTRVDAGEGVVVVSHAELALVLRGVAVRVADERALPLLTVELLCIKNINEGTYVVMKLVPREGQLVGTMLGVK